MTNLERDFPPFGVIVSVPSTTHPSFLPFLHFGPFFILACSLSLNMVILLVLCVLNKHLVVPLNPLNECKISLLCWPWFPLAHWPLPPSLSVSSLMCCYVVWWRHDGGILFFKTRSPGVRENSTFLLCACAPGSSGVCFSNDGMCRLDKRERAVSPCVCFRVSASRPLLEVYLFSVVMLDWVLDTRRVLLWHKSGGLTRWRVAGEGKGGSICTIITLLCFITQLYPIWLLGPFFIFYWRATNMN